MNLKNPGSGLDVDVSGDIAGIFFVKNANESIDSKARKIIPMQDFVEAYNVCTVFGIGGRYMLGSNNIVSIIFFTNEKFREDISRRFVPLINIFKTSTVKLVRQQRIFTN